MFFSPVQYIRVLVVSISVYLTYLGVFVRRPLVIVFFYVRMYVCGCLRATDVAIRIPVRSPGVLLVPAFSRLHPDGPNM